jgi:sulfur transfer complex TusBCD TusB component (DsrH family)
VVAGGSGGGAPASRTYLFIESRSEQESPDVLATLGLVGGLRQAGHDVSLFLVQNAVTMAGRIGELADLSRVGVTVWADDYSLATRGLPAPPGDDIKLGGVSDVVRILTTPGVVPVWH